MTPTEDLIREHNAIEEMLSIMSKIAGNIEKDKGFDTRDVEKIIDFLRTFADKWHHGKEESALFPALAMTGIQVDIDSVDVMLQEHNVGRGYINGLIAGVEDYKKNYANSYGLVSACLTNYVNLLHSHIQKEEDVLFPMANKILGEKERNKILEQFIIIEKEVIGHSDIEQYHELLKQLKIKYIDSASQ
jgi:hemerythrin-like domain-containing protein